MPWTDGFIAVDWGTTNRRAYRIAPDGSCEDELADDQGILSVPSGGFERAIAEIRERLGQHPMLMAGMIGSNRGWIEVPYAECPAGLADLAAQLAWAPDRSAAIVPGVADMGERADVMRGEEAQVLGALAASDIPENCILCHPGTHNKWVRVRGGRIVSFRTVMTGEIFNLLKDGSILSDLLQGEIGSGPAFREGVRSGLAGTGVTAELFEARARVVLGRMDRADAGAFISGLLIGEDVRIGLSENREDDIVVMGRPDLTRRYALALEEAGVEARELDGERAFIAGARAIVELME